MNRSLKCAWLHSAAVLIVLALSARAQAQTDALAQADLSQAEGLNADQEAREHHLLVDAHLEDVEGKVQLARGMRAVAFVGGLAAIATGIVVAAEWASYQTSLAAYDLSSSLCFSPGGACGGNPPSRGDFSASLGVLMVSLLVTVCAALVYYFVAHQPRVRQAMQLLGNSPFAPPPVRPAPVSDPGGL